MVGGLYCTNMSAHPGEFDLVCKPDERLSDVGEPGADQDAEEQHSVLAFHPAEFQRHYVWSSPHVDQVET